MKFAASALLLGSISSVAPAAPVYLECTAVSTNGHIRHLQIGLNEGEGTAQYTVVETGFTETQRAIFAPTKVYVGDDNRRVSSTYERRPRHIAVLIGHGWN